MRELLILGAVGLGAWMLMRRQGSNAEILDARDAWAQGIGMPVDTTILDANDAWAQNGGAPVDEGQGDYIDPMGSIVPVTYWGDQMRWNESMIPAQYLQSIRNAESKYSLPRNLLARQLWQESRYDPTIVNRYSGAQGIAQFMPATADSFGIDPFNAAQAIDAAGKYMRQLYGQVGSWLLALAAYNWGIGNVLRKGIGKAPTETKNYYSQILADIGMSTVTA